MYLLPAVAGPSNWQRRYGVILADPPWNYNNTGVEGAAEGQYNTMPKSDIRTMPVSDLAAPDGVLLMWCTWPQMDVGIEVIKAWGFQYVTGFPWMKIIGQPQYSLFGELLVRPQYGIGFWVRGCTEAVLIGKRGNAKPPDNGWMGLLSENYHHSRKPDNLYEYAESLPGPYLELFARRRRAGWDAFGNEVADSIVLPAPAVA